MGRNEVIGESADIVNKLEAFYLGTLDLGYIIDLGCALLPPHHALSLRYLSFLLLRPGSGAEYCNQPVCMSVCLSVCEHISVTAGSIFTKFCVRISRGRGSVIPRRRRATLCTSGCMDDVMAVTPTGGVCTML